MGKKVKVYDVKRAYLANADNLSNFSMAKAYILSHSSRPMASGYYSIIEYILMQRFKQEWKRKLIHKVVADAKELKAKTLSIPKLGLTHVVLHELLSSYVSDNFGEMYKEYLVYQQADSNPYPIALTNSVRRAEQKLAVK